MKKEDLLKTASFSLTNGHFLVTEEVQNCFRKHGFIIIRGLLDAVEVDRLRAGLEQDEMLKENSYGRDDGEGGRTKVVLWSHPGHDLPGLVARSCKVAGTFAQLLGGEIYHYHSKVIMKEAHAGGAHVWHQDYGFWYNNGNLEPNMGTAWIAVDRATIENGCLKVIPGSHSLGRVDHVLVGDQAGADLTRVDMAVQRMGFLEVEMEPGDALIFHCNLLHRSDQNRSPHRRWAFLVAYNRADNQPDEEHPGHPRYFQLDMVPNDAIRNEKVDKEGERQKKGFLRNVKADPGLKALIDAAK